VLRAAAGRSEGVWAVRRAVLCGGHVYKREEVRGQDDEVGALELLCFWCQTVIVVKVKSPFLASI